MTRKTQPSELHRRRPDGHTGSAIDGEPAPRLPAEHDESSDSSDAPPQGSMRQAHDDVVSGQVDTDRSGGVTDAAYRRQQSGGSAAAPAPSPSPATAPALRKPPDRVS